MFTFPTLTETEKGARMQGGKRGVKRQACKGARMQGGKRARGKHAKGQGCKGARRQGSDARRLVASGKPDSRSEYSERK